MKLQTFSLLAIVTLTACNNTTQQASSNVAEPDNATNTKKASLSAEELSVALREQWLESIQYNTFFAGTEDFEATLPNYIASYDIDGDGSEEFLLAQCYDTPASITDFIYIGIFANCGEGLKTIAIACMPGRGQMLEVHKGGFVKYEVDSESGMSSNVETYKIEKSNVGANYILDYELRENEDSNSQEEVITYYEWHEGDEKCTEISKEKYTKALESCGDLIELETFSWESYSL